jgi:hypothetical protein
MTSSVVLLLFLNEKPDFCYSRVFFSSFDFGFDLDLRALSQISRSISFSVSKRCPWFDLFFPAFCSSLDSGRASFSVPTFWPASEGRLSYRLRNPLPLARFESKLWF